MWSSAQLEKRRHDVDMCCDANDELIKLEKATDSTEDELKQAKAKHDALRAIIDEHEVFFAQVERMRLHLRKVVQQKFNCGRISWLKPGDTITDVILNSDYSFERVWSGYSPTFITTGNRVATDDDKIIHICSSVGEIGLPCVSITYVTIMENKRCYSCGSTEDAHTHVDHIVDPECKGCAGNDGHNVDGVCIKHWKCDKCLIDAPCPKHSTRLVPIHQYTVVYTMPQN